MKDNKKDELYRILLNLEELLENIVNNIHHHYEMLDDGIKWVEEEE